MTEFCFFFIYIYIYIYILRFTEHFSHTSASGGRDFKWCDLYNTGHEVFDHVCHVRANPLTIVITHYSHPSTTHLQYSILHPVATRHVSFFIFDQAIIFTAGVKKRFLLICYSQQKWYLLIAICSCLYPIYQPLRSGRIWHKVDF